MITKQLAGMDRDYQKIFEADTKTDPKHNQEKIITRVQPTHITEVHHL
jgi:hypothetical protein